MLNCNCQPTRYLLFLMNQQHRWLSLDQISKDTMALFSCWLFARWPAACRCPFCPSPWQCTWKRQVQSQMLEDNFDGLACWKKCFARAWWCQCRVEAKGEKQNPCVEWLSSLCIEIPSFAGRRQRGQCKRAVIGYLFPSNSEQPGGKH